MAGKCLPRFDPRPCPHLSADSASADEDSTLTETDAEAAATWRYPGRYQTCDVSEVVTSEAGFWPSNTKRPVGDCCFGHEARVPGALEEITASIAVTRSDSDPIYGAIAHS